MWELIHKLPELLAELERKIDKSKMELETRLTKIEERMAKIGL